MISGSEMIFQTEIKKTVISSGREDKKLPGRRNNSLFDVISCYTKKYHEVLIQFRVSSVPVSELWQAGPDMKLA